MKTIKSFMQIFRSPSSLVTRHLSLSFYLSLSVFICGCLSLVVARQAPQTPSIAKASVDLIVSGGTIVTMDAERRVIPDGALVVRGSEIVAVGKRADVEGKYAAKKRMDARGRLVLPGLINGHGHAPMTLLRGIADDMTLQDWLTKFIFPAEARNVSEEFVIAGTRLAALEMIKGGTTTFADMYYFEDAIAREAKAAGMRGVLGETILDFPAPDNKTREAMLAYSEKYILRWKGDPLIHAAIAPHAAFTNSPETLKLAATLARRHGAPILIHLSETKLEIDEIREKYGRTPTQHLESLGFLGPDVLAAHCVWLDTEDMAILARREVGCVHNPSSNMMLASGVAKLGEMQAAGMRVGIGTDGPAGSNNDLNLMEEIDLAAKLQKVSRKDPQAFPAEKSLALATIEGARALHMEEEVGSLEVGKKADFIILRTNMPHAVPAYNVYSQIVYSMKANDVESVVIHGRTVMLNRRVLTLSEPAILSRAKEFADKVKKSLAQ
jgi:5-methylthioadenosine/S-adenosylhomocysteine deaminase